MDVVEFEPVVKRISVLAASAFAASLYKWFEHLPKYENVAEGAQAVHTPIHCCPKQREIRSKHLEGSVSYGTLPAW